MGLHSKTHPFFVY